jgi:hypothetical protein
MIHRVMIPGIPAGQPPEGSAADADDLRSRHDDTSSRLLYALQLLPMRETYFAQLVASPPKQKLPMIPWNQSFRSGLF